MGDAIRFVHSYADDTTLYDIGFKKENNLQHALNLLKTLENGIFINIDNT